MEPFSLSIEDFRASDWQSLIQNIEHECRTYCDVFVKQAIASQQNNDQMATAIYSTLANLTSFHLNLDNPNDPFSPEPVPHTQPRENNFRSMSKEIREILLILVHEITDSEMKARVADILWVLKSGDYRIAGLAVDAYLESAHILENPKEWTDCYRRIDRALQIASQLGRGQPVFNKVIAYIEEVLARLDGTDPLWFSHRLMSLLLDSKQGDPKKYIALSEKIAVIAETERFWRRAREYWELKAEWHSRDTSETKDDEARKAQQVAAETYVKAAEDFLSFEPPRFLYASTELAQAVEALRRAKSPPERVKEIHRKLLECQAHDDDFETYSFTIDLTDPVQKTVEAVKGKSLDEAILTLAAMYRPMSVDKLRKQTLEQKTRSPIYFWIMAQQLDERGRIIEKRSGLSHDDDDANEQAIRAEMMRNAAFEMRVHGQAYVLAAVNQINLEHYLQLDDLVEFVKNNPFVPSGQELIFLRGLKAGISGDFMVAAHLLIPQIENSIRHILEQSGVIVSSFDSQHIAEDFALNKLLYEIPETTQIFGEDMVFTLKTLLVSRFGFNLRNLSAHGRLTAASFATPIMAYLWWVVLYLCSVPILNASLALDAENNEGENTSQMHSSEDADID